MNVRRWLHEHSLKLLAIRDTPEAIAGGVAIGIFFGFTPFFGLKTISAIFFAWLTRSNILAAVLAGTLHDIILPFMPIVYRWEYDVGFWLLSQPHQWPPSFVKAHWETMHWRNWTHIAKIGEELLLGSVVCTGPVAAVAYFVTKKIVTRHQMKKQSQPTAESGGS
jgi:uncharacterized protein (TIGR03546 family)